MSDFSDTAASRAHTRPKFGDAALAVATFLALGGHAHQTFDLISVQWVGAAILLCTALAVCKGAGRSLFGRADLPLFALLLFAIVSLVWTPVPVVGAVFAVKLLFFCSLTASLRLAFAAGRESAIMLGVAAALAQALALSYVPLNSTTFGGYANQNFLVEAVLMMLPWVGAFAVARGTKNVLGVFLLLVLAAALWFAFFVSKSKVPILVFGGLGLAALPFVLVRVGGMGILAIGFVLAALGWGAAERGYLSFAVSIGDRAEIFFNTVAMAWDRLPFGGGAGSFTVFYPLFQERHLALLPDQYLIQRNNLIGAAHNDLLQLFADFGVVGLASLAGVVLIVVRGYVRSRGTAGEAARGAALISLTAGAIAGLVGFPFQNPATFVLAALALGALTVQAPGLASAAMRPAHPARVWTERLLVGTFAIGFLAASCSNVMAYREFRFMVIMRHAAPDSAFAAHVRALKWAPWDGYIGQTLFVTYMSWSSLVDRRYSAYPSDRVELIADPLAVGPTNAEIFALSRGFAPYNFNLAYGRVQYLLNARLHQQNRVELDRLLGEIRTSVPNLGETLVLEAYAAVVDKNLAALTRAIARAESPTVRWRGEGLRQGFNALAAEAARMRSEGPRYAFTGVVHLEW
jgi:O-antigen ligase